MKKTIVFICICCTFFTNVFASRPINATQEKIALEYMLEAQKLLWESKNNTDPLLYDTLNNTFNAMNCCLKREKDWAYIFLCGTNIMIPVCTETLSMKVFAYTGKRLKYDKETMEKIYKCFVASYTASGGQIDDKMVFEDTDEEIELPVCCATTFLCFTDIGDNEVNDRFYDCYRSYMIERKERLICEGLEMKSRAALILETMPEFNAKAVAQAVSAGIFAILPASDMRTKCAVFATTFLGAIAYNCIEKAYFHMEKMDEITECYEKSRECFKQADDIQEWLWNN